MKKYLSRKFLLILFSIIFLGLSLWAEKVNADQFVFGMTTALGIYAGANVVQKKIE